MRQNQNLTNLLGWFMVMIFTFAHTPLANAVIFTAAAWGGEHEVRVQNTGEKVTIVLHHQGCARQHGSITKALLLFSNSTEDSHQDHVLSCAAATNLPLYVSSKLADPKLDSLANIAIGAVESYLFKTGLFATSLKIARPPPLDVIVSSSALECLKTIVLLV